MLPLLILGYVGVVLAAGECEVANCLECVVDYPKQCRLCQDDYRLNIETASCEKCPDGTWGPRCSTIKCWLTVRVNCLECSGTDRCWRCEDGYYVTWYGGCGSCAEGTGGYECQDIVCNGVTVSNCQSCDLKHSGVCGVCKDNFRLNPETHICEACTDRRVGKNCIALMCSSRARSYCSECTPGANTCKTCLDNYGPDSSGECQRCTGNSGGPNCTLLKCNGMVADNCQSCYMPDDAVLIPGACKVCKSTYYKAPNNPHTCTPCPDNRFGDGIVCNTVRCNGVEQTNCRRCEKGGTNCVLCDIGYGPNSEGKCVPCGEGTGGENCRAKTCTTEQLELAEDCKYCQPDGSCAQCQDGFLLDQKECVTPTGCDEEHCRSCTSEGGKETCRRCAHGWYLVSARCIKCQENCLRCRGPGACTFCDEGYTLNTGMCLPSSVEITTSCGPANCVACYTSSRQTCAVCIEGYVWNNNEATCVVACPDPNCIDCNRETGQCKRCSTNYGLSEATCYPCTLSGCTRCAFSIDETIGSSREVCTHCTAGTLSPDGLCAAAVRMSTQATVAYSAGAVVIVLLALVGVGLFLVFRKKRPAPSDNASEAMQDVNGSTDGNVESIENRRF